MANLNFDAANVAPADDFSLLPPGDYTAVITASEMKETKAGNGSYLALTFEITEGPSKGRKQWSNLNLLNQNPKAVEIAQRDLSAICHAVDVLQVKDSQELHYKPMVIRVDVEQRDGYSPRNAIKAYKKLDGAATQAGASAGANPFAPPASSGSTTATAPSDGQPFWQRNAA